MMRTWLYFNAIIIIMFSCTILSEDLTMQLKHDVVFLDWASVQFLLKYEYFGGCTLSTIPHFDD